MIIILILLNFNLLVTCNLVSFYETGHYCNSCNETCEGKVLFNSTMLVSYDKIVSARVTSESLRQRVGYKVCISKNKVSSIRTDKDVDYFTYSNDCKHCLNNSCDGNLLYCSENECNSTSDCFCTREEFKREIEYYDENVRLWEEPEKCVFKWVNNLVRLEHKPFKYGNLKRSVSQKQPKFCNINGTFYDIKSCPLFSLERTFFDEVGAKLMLSNFALKRYNGYTTISFDNPVITVFTPVANKTTVLVSRSIFSKFIECDSDPCTYRLPKESLENEGTLFVQTYIDGDLDNQATFELRAVSTCSLPNCLFCSEMISEFSCLPGPMQAWIIATGLILLIILLLLILLLVSCCFCLEWKFSYGERVFSNMSNKDVLVTVVVYSMLIMSVAACDNVHYISSQSVDCYQNLNTKVCTVSMNVMINLEYIGHKFCISLLDEKGLVMETMSVRYDQALVVNTLVQDYWTAAWNPMVWSDKACRGTEECDGGCDPEPTDYVTWDGKIINSGSENFPGQSFCTDTCGCAGCGCVICDSACTYGRFAFQPVPNAVYSVNKIGTSREIPFIEVCYNTSCSDLSLSSNALETVGPFKYGLLSSLHHDEYNGGKKLLIRLDEGRVSWNHANKPNEIVAGMIGDVQGTTPTAFTNPSSSSFKYPVNAFTYYVSNGQIYYSYAQSGLNQLLFLADNIQQGAVLENNILWNSYSTGQIAGVKGNAKPIVLRLFSEVPVNFTRTIYEVCPKILEYDFRGCHSCESGFYLTISAKSDCLAGTVTVQVKETFINVLTPSIELTQTAQEYELRFVTGQDEVFFTLCLRSDHYEECIDLHTTLEDPNIVLPPNLNYTYNGTDRDHDWFLNMSLGAQVGVSIGFGFTGLILILLAVAAGYLILSQLSRKQEYIKLLNESSEFNAKTEDVNEFEDVDEDI